MDKPNSFLVFVKRLVELDEPPPPSDLILQSQALGLARRTAVNSSNLYKKNPDTDVCIIGGGVIGSSTAFFTAKRFAELGLKKNIVVIEQDPTYKFSASALSASSIRHQFSTPTSVKISQFGTEFLRNVKAHLSTPEEEAPDLSFREGGYLFLATEAGRATLEENTKLVQSLGSKVVLLTPQETNSRFPWLSTEGVVASSLGLEGEGWFDSYSLLRGYKKKAVSLGVKYLKDRVVGIEMGRGIVEGQVHSTVSEIFLQSGKKLKIQPTSVVLNSAGTGARALMEQIQGKEATERNFPIFPRKRCVFVFSCEDKTINNSPLVIDTSGVYWRPEGQHFIAGVSPVGERDPNVAVDDFTVDYSIFEEIIWPALAARVPSFESIKMTSAWAGHYDVNTFDHNALVGRHPEVGNLLVANGFTGHGLQQSPAVGRGLSELIVSGRYETLDLSEFQLERVEENRPIVEKNVI